MGAGTATKEAVQPVRVIPPDVPTCGCDYPDRPTERRARQDFLRTYGDDLPDEVIEDMTSDKLWDNWEVRCRCDDPTHMIAAGHWKPSDWYLCTIRGLAVSEEERGKGIGRDIAGSVLKKAWENPDCLVFAADVSYDNIPSQRSLMRYGFDTVGEFCWGEGQKPADILHLVKVKPTEDKTCLGP